MEKTANAKQNKKMDPTRVIVVGLTVLGVYTSALLWIVNGFARNDVMNKIDQESKTRDASIREYVDKRHDEVKEILADIKNEGRLTSERVWQILKTLKSK